MCMLYIQPQGLALPNEYFTSLWNYNPDGLSIFNLKNGKLFKTMDKKQAQKMLCKTNDSDLIVHFRMGTSGEITKNQLHGFVVGNGQFRLFHNGILRTFQGDAKKSDTQKLADFFKTMSLVEMIDYLEKNEKTSRFLIVDIKTKDIHQPKCAEWNEPTNVGDGKIIFSNSYAIDYSLLYDDAILYDDFFYTSVKYGDETDLIEIINNGTVKDLDNFIFNNPEVVSDFLSSLKNVF